MSHVFDVSDLVRTVTVRGVEIKIAPLPYDILARALRVGADDAAARDLTIEAVERCCTYADDGGKIECGQLPARIIEELAAKVMDMVAARENFSAPPSQNRSATA